MDAEGVVFDLDGVLVDSEGIWTAAERATVEGLGREYTGQIRAMLHGRGQRAGAQLLAAAFDHTDTEAIASTLLGHGLDGLRFGVRSIPGARQLVSALRGRVPLGVASSSVRVVVETELASAAFDGVVDVIVSGDDTAAAKPAPDPYLVACERLGIQARRTVAIEDSPAGVASAKAAGLIVIGLQAVPGVRLDKADRVVRSLEQLRPDDLSVRWSHEPRPVGQSHHPWPGRLLRAEARSPTRLYGSTRSHPFRPGLLPRRSG